MIIKLCLIQASSAFFKNGNRQDIAGSRSDAESIPYKERYGKWSIENKNILIGCKDPIANNSFNDGGEKVNTPTPEYKAITASLGKLLKQPGEKNGEKNLNNRDS